MDEITTLPWIDENTIADRFPTIYHYTKVRTLKSILTSGGLYATHFAHTNDVEEFYGLREVLPELAYAPAMALAKRLRAKSAFKRAPSNDALERIIPADARNFHDSMVRALPLPFHLTCFSKHLTTQNQSNGLLTLWRFYGGEGEGIALGLNTRRLIDATNSLIRSHSLSAVYIDEVRYRAEDNVLLARLADAPGLVEMFLEFMESLISGRELEFDERGKEMIQFTVLAACAKHADFADEREIRLVATPAFPGHENGRKSALIGDERFMLLPYLEALERVIIGPSSDQGALTEQVAVTLQMAGLKSVRVDQSRTPFRFVHR
jgi:hypothetical protein